MLILLTPCLASSLKVSLLPILTHSSSSRSRTVTIERSRWDHFHFQLLLHLAPGEKLHIHKQVPPKPREPPKNAVMPKTSEFLPLVSTSLSTSWYWSHFCHRVRSLPNSLSIISFVTAHIDRCLQIFLPSCDILGPESWSYAADLLLLLYVSTQQPPNHQPIQPFEERPQPAACATCYIMIMLRKK